MTSKDITQISVIAAILTILAVLKIPSIIPGLDFQLSAPAALLILAFFGIKKYFLGGLLSSLLLLVFGVFNPISIIFRVIAIAVVYLLKINVLSLVLASVLGSLVSRLLLSIILNLPVWVVLLNAIPGVIFTLIVAIPLYLTLRKRMAVLLR